MHPVIAWAEAHPNLTALILWPVFSFVVTLLFGPHTEAQLARYPAWLSRLLHWTGALGIDAPKVIALAKSKMRPPGPPPLLVFVAVAMLASGVVSACSSAPVTPREQARGAVLAVAEAVHVADETCASVALARHDRDLASTCADAYDEARAALVATATAVDAWDDATTRTSVLCRTAAAVRGLEAISYAVRAAGASVPPIVDDALALASALGRCTTGDGGQA